MTIESTLQSSSQSLCKMINIVYDVVCSWYFEIPLKSSSRLLDIQPMKFSSLIFLFSNFHTQL